MTGERQREGGAYALPDLVNLVNDKEVGFFFLPGGKIGPGESALVLRSTAEFIVHKGAACHIEERDPEGDYIPMPRFLRRNPDE